MVAVEDDEPGFGSRRSVSATEKSCSYARLWPTYMISTTGFDRAVCGMTANVVLDKTAWLIDRLSSRTERRPLATEPTCAACTVVDWKGRYRQRGLSTNHRLARMMPRAGARLHGA